MKSGLKLWVNVLLLHFIFFLSPCFFGKTIVMKYFFKFCEKCAFKAFGEKGAQQAFCPSTTEDT
jgi:hypothetical protein